MITAAVVVVVLAVLVSVEVDSAPVAATQQAQQRIPKIIGYNYKTSLQMR